MENIHTITGFPDTSVSQPYQSNDIISFTSKKEKYHR